MRIQSRVARKHGVRGGALLASLICVIVMSGFAVAVLGLSLAHKQEVGSSGRSMRALYLAEAGLSDCLMQLATSKQKKTTVPVQIGTKAAPVGVRSGKYYCSLVDNGDETYTVTATGTSMLSRRTIEAVIAPVTDDIFDHAVFAGNEDGDPNYTLPFGGVGAQADQIDGDVYSGNDIDVWGDATLTGDAAAAGMITGVAGTQGVSRSAPDISAMNYETNHDFDVATMFAAATLQSNALGGTAYELPESSPAHIFRKNPDDRLDEINGTPKDDFFLEDPYMPVTDFTAAFNGKEGHTISLSGTMGAPGPSGTDKVYYIDGNLWVHNKPFGRLRFYNTDPEGAKITFVVKGNIYFSDDVLLGDPASDGVAFVAIEDAAEPDSGNVYLGDPRYGTLERMEAFMFAENNFYDNNLDETGSSEVTIVGNMTAGNQVAIDRDFVDENGNVQHSKLSVQFDNRISTGNLLLPGIPNATSGIAGFNVVYWREVPTP